MSLFGFLTRSDTSTELPDIFPMPVMASIFVKTDLITIYSKILTDTIERTEGIPKEVEPALWDNCLGNEHDEGLITLLAKAMESMSDLFLVYKEKVIRKADSVEESQIRLDYKKAGKSTVGIYVSFTSYRRTEMVKLYSAIEYGVIASLHKGVNVSKALQYKINDLRASVGLNDSEKAKAQATLMATALSRGKDVYMDSKDEITSHQPDLDATQKSIEFLDSKRCFYLGLPRSYVNGESAGGLGDSGVGDAKAVERGLKAYFVSIVKPVIKAIFDKDTTFKSTDMSQVNTALEVLKTFDLVSEKYISDDNKLMIVNKILDVDSELGEEPEPEVPTVPSLDPDPAKKDEVKV